jgi:hypothetical protein
VFTARFEVGVANRIVVIGVVLDTLALGVGSVIEQDPASGDTVLGPVVYAAFEVGGWACDVGAFGAVVEGCCGRVGEVTEAVPLGPGLGVEVVDVVVGVVFGEGLDLVLKGFAVECWLFGFV